MWNRGYCQSLLRLEQEEGFSSPQRGRLKIAQYFKCWDKSVKEVLVRERDERTIEEFV